MYLHLGQNILVPMSSVIGIFDMDNTTGSPVTRTFLTRAEKEGRVVNICEDIPKSFAVCEEGGKTTIYLSQLSSSTLLRRSESFSFD